MTTQVTITSLGVKCILVWLATLVAEIKRVKRTRCAGDSLKICWVTDGTVKRFYEQP